MIEIDAGSRCPECGKRGLKRSWRPDGDMVQVEYVCSDIECRRARQPWFVLVPQASREVNACPMCGQPYLKHLPSPEDKGLYIHEVQKDIGFLRVTRGCYHGHQSDFAVGG